MPLGVTDPNYCSDDEDKGGNDKISAGSGNDDVQAGRGNDTVRGNDGARRPDGESGNDRVSGCARQRHRQGPARATTALGGTGRRRRHDGLGQRPRSSSATAPGTPSTAGSGKDKVNADRKDSVASNCERSTRRAEAAVPSAGALRARPQEDRCTRWFAGTAPTGRTSTRSPTGSTRSSPRRVSGEPGFCDYQVLDGGDGTIVSITIFGDEAGARRSTQMAAECGGARACGDLRLERTDAFGGEVLVSRAADAVLQPAHH